MAPSVLQLSSLSLLLLSTINPSSAGPAVIVRRAAVNTAALPTGWSYKGCYVDNANGRALGSSAYVSGTAMTEQACASFCQSGGYPFAGVEYSQECYCGSSFTAATAPEADCSMTCTGDATEPCGGSNRLNVFENPAIVATVNPGPGNWGSMGCYSDNAGARTLTFTAAVVGGAAANTVELCVAACETQSYLYAGVEYSGECYCGNAFSNGGGPAPDGNAQCNMLCNGNKLEICGGPNRLNVYGFGFPKTSSSSSASATATNPGTTSSKLLAESKSPAVTSTKKSTSTSKKSTSTSKKTSTSTKKTSTSTKKMSTSTKKTSTTSKKTSTSTKKISTSTKTSATSKKTSTSTKKISTSTKTSATSKKTSTSTKKTSTSTKKTSTTSKKTSTSTKKTSTSTKMPTSTSTKRSTASSTKPATTTNVVSGWSALGCYTDSVALRSLANGVAVPGGAAAMTVELCQAACKAAGFTLAGVEYSAECYCDNAWRNGGGPAPDGNAQCNMPCNGNAAETCGGANRLNAYTYTTGTQSSTTNPATTTTGTATGTTSNAPTGTSAGTATNLPVGWTYQGCWIDNTQGRIMTGPVADTATMTIETCIALCDAQGMPVAGLQYASQCFCDTVLHNSAVLAATDGTCAMKCSGSTTEVCGGPNLDSVYAKGALTVIQPAASQKTGLPGQWVFMGCLTDQTPRSLSMQLILKTTNQASTCLKACSDYGYTAAGMEYGEECYCGDISEPIAAGATLRPEAECSQVCSGNPNYLCGAGNRLSYYNWQGAPINNYGYPVGNAAGQYQFLVDGPVVPLVTSQGLNGKVTFVEKSGTSTTPGSTGAYELDLSTLTFRTMHVKTDVFCSASLTLPDKVGRQINIGGWSGDSTYGIRLYWPDGSPGVPGTNDWQENFQEVALQAGRWYPSAMIMANGSILVVGGESGSNGPPVPSLELLPRSGGTVYCDWLQRTDPYNLYPFLAVLPSGGIFVAYYNEARILSPTTFGTIKTLPNMPGPVNNPNGGRTYPLEGTMVLLPQYAPYDQPLGVLICGGSTPFGGNAIDNCISSIPESATPQWIIEKMPSKRVMTCMTALPDGTYLILNGAHVGVAGFGLASDANHNAILYDPTKPAKSRMSIMANTTIDRFYHSEAILLADGRVLVSGSDPETTGLLQETRVEVFVPPYLLNGKIRPSFSITNKNWGYGAAITVTITLPSGIASQAKFSLMGAESSTHGNSMGQRTIFPAVTCTTTSCTITAPPNANICPPGWFQLFLLDGPTPSKSVYVRIGGDPANLGAWPIEPDFTIPGSG